MSQYDFPELNVSSKSMESDGLSFSKKMNSFVFQNIDGAVLWDKKQQNFKENIKLDRV